MEKTKPTMNWNVSGSLSVEATVLESTCKGVSILKTYPYAKLDSGLASEEQQKIVGGTVALGAGLQNDKHQDR